MTVIQVLLFVAISTLTALVTAGIGLAVLVGCCYVGRKVVAWRRRKR